MKPEIRQILAREPFPEKIRKVAQLIRLAKTFRANALTIGFPMKSVQGCHLQTLRRPAVEVNQCSLKKTVPR